MKGNIMCSYVKLTGPSEKFQNYTCSINDTKFLINKHFVLLKLKLIPFT